MDCFTYRTNSKKIKHTVYVSSVSVWLQHVFRITDDVLPKRAAGEASHNPEKLLQLRLYIFCSLQQRYTSMGIMVLETFYLQAKKPLLQLDWEIENIGDINCWGAWVVNEAVVDQLWWAALDHLSGLLEWARCVQEWDEMGSVVGATNGTVMDDAAVVEAVHTVMFPPCFDNGALVNDIHFLSSPGWNQAHQWRLTHAPLQLHPATS